MEGALGTPHGIIDPPPPNRRSIRRPSTPRYPTRCTRLPSCCRLQHDDAIMEDTFAAMTSVLKGKQSANGCQAAATMFTLIYANSEWWLQRLQRRQWQCTGWTADSAWAGVDLYARDSVITEKRWYPHPPTPPDAPWWCGVRSLLQSSA